MSVRPDPLSPESFESLQEIYLSNRPSLLNVATRITGCRSHAEDVVQDAFFRLNRSSLSNIRSQLSYLFQVVRNLSIDHYRKQTLEHRYAAPEAEGLDVVNHCATPEEINAQQQTLELVQQALAQLPERTRYAFEAYRLQGRPQKDIARDLGVSPTLVNFMIRDAMVHCRAEIQRSDSEFAPKH